MKLYILQNGAMGYTFVHACAGGRFLWGRYIGYDGEAFDLDATKHAALIARVKREGKLVRDWPRTKIQNGYLPD